MQPIAGRPGGDGASKTVQGPPAELRTRMIQAAYEAAIAEGRFEAPQTRRTMPRARLYRDGRLTLLAPFFDYAFYAYENPDFASSGLDELEHFNFFGWRRLRNPAAWFDTSYYLASNPDVRISGDNPFWHYIFKGRIEGRAPRRPRAAERAILAGLVSPAAQGGEAEAPALPRLGAEELAAALAPHLAGATGLALLVNAAAPHAKEALPFLAEEAAGLAARGFVVIGASPLRASSVLKTMPAPWSETRLTLAGDTLGVGVDAEIAKALASLREAMPAERALVVHGVLGLSADGLIAIAAALEPTRPQFWLHDYSSLCTSPKLLRNDVAFCGAPPPDSQACGVCIHGEARRAQLAAMERLFQRCRFRAVSPSQSALTFWRGRFASSCESTVVIEPARLVELDSAREVEVVGEIGAEGRPVRVAYLGEACLAEGWLTFERLLETCGELVAYAFYHLADADDLRASRNVFNVEAPLPPETPDALRDLLIERRIDLVVMAAEWPRAFSFAALEALAAGCDLLALRHSGHIAALVESERRGRLFEDDAELVAFFASGRAIAYARERERFPRAIAAVRRLPAAEAG